MVGFEADEGELLLSHDGASPLPGNHRDSGLSVPEVMHDQKVDAHREDEQTVAGLATGELRESSNNANLSLTGSP